MAKPLCKLLFSMVLMNVVFCGICLEIRLGSDSSQLSWTREAAEEAEEVADITCSGHGTAFLDSLDDGGKPLCDCHGCFTGPDCSVRSQPCVANALKGDPLFLEAFWKNKKQSSAVLVSGWHRMSYTYLIPDDDEISVKLEMYIRKLHDLVGNAVIKGRHIVFGTGSIQLINAAIHALSSSSSNLANLYN